MAEGIVSPTSRIDNGKAKTPNVLSLNLKYGFFAKGNKWEDYYYGMPYWGVGFYKPYYSMNKEMGSPFSAFLFQGATLKKFGSGVSLNYEINLGLSFNWNHYDALKNPSFEALGSSVNAHLGGNLYFKKPISKRFDLHLGIDVLHFSNGAQRTPNYGINSMSAVVGLAYNMVDGGSHGSIEGRLLTPSKFEKRTMHDISFFVTRHTLNVDTAGANLRSRYTDRGFRIVGLNYAFMWHNTRRFMWGPGLDISYDEGHGVSIYGNISEETRIYEEIVKLGSVAERFNVGLSLKGELVMPGYSIFASLGYSVLRGAGDKRLYQTYGVKVYLFDGLSSSFGVKSNNLTNSKFLFLSIGYAFCKYRKK